MSLSSLLLATGHLLSTSTFNLTAWTALVWLGLRALRSHDERWWLVAGAATGIGLLDSDLVFFLAAALVVGVIIAGPRQLLRSPWFLAGIAVALAMWAPYLIWQAQHGWPEFAIARSIAHGGSRTSAPRGAFLPEQFLLSGPLLSPIWVIGLVVLWRRPELRWVRSFMVAIVELVVIFIVTDGKPYYIGGMLPLLFAAGADAVWGWTRRAHLGRRSIAVGLLVILSLPDAVITLPVVPIDDLHRTSIVAINNDVGETVGWPVFVREIAGVYRRVPAQNRPGAIVLASNYGEAGAVERYGPGLGLPKAYGVQNAFWLWGPPAPSAHTAIAVGFDRSQLTPIFRRVEAGTELNNHESINDDEQYEPVYLCSGLLRPWTSVWRSLRDYG
jgi:hypothetical protein